VPAEEGGWPEFVIARGLGTVAHDAEEAAALARVLGGGVPVTAIKGATGYLGAASGLVEVAVAIRALAAGIVPAVTRLEETGAGPMPAFVRAPRRLARQPGGRALACCGGWGGEWAVTAVSQPRDAAPER
jgi:3-oxoacyl-[acyl-carrier-protein] synthase II